MTLDNKIKLLIISLLSILLVGTVYAEVFKDIAPNTYNRTFISAKAGNDWNLVQTFWSWSKVDARDVDYSKDFWLPIKPWEYQVCRNGLSTQLQSKDDVGSGYGGIYETAMTVAAYRREASKNDTFLYEITWYFQPTILADKGKYYSVNVTTPNGKPRVIQEKKGAGQVNGDYGYLPFYSDVKYTNVTLFYGGNVYTYPIIPTNDTSRSSR